MLAGCRSAGMNIRWRAVWLCGYMPPGRTTGAGGPPELSSTAPGKYPTRVVTSCLLTTGLFFSMRCTAVRAHAATSSQIIADVSGSTAKIVSVVNDCFLLRKRYGRRPAVIIALNMP